MMFLFDCLVKMLSSGLNSLFFSLYLRFTKVFIENSYLNFDIMEREHKINDDFMMLGNQNHSY